MRLREAVAALSLALLAGTLTAQDTSERAVARRRLPEAAKELKLIGEEARQTSRYWTGVGRKFYEDYQFQFAAEALKKALALDPANEEAQKLLYEVNARLGERIAKVKTYLERLDEETRARIEESLVELSNHIDLAKRYYNRAMAPAPEEIADQTQDRVLAAALKHLGTASGHSARARDILRWLPYDLDVTQQQEAVRKLAADIKAAQALKEAELTAYSRNLAEAEAEKRRITEREAEKKKIRTLLDQGKMYMSRLEYEKAARIGKEVLKLEPTNSEADGLMWQARWSDVRAREEKIRKERIEEKKSLNDQLDEATVPYSAYLIYPEDWDEISRRESVAVQEAEEPEWKKEIRRKMDRRVSFEFVDTPLTEAVTFLHALTELNIIIDPRALEEVGGDINITLRVADMPLDLALKWILRLAGLDYTLKSEAVFISTAQKLAGEVDLRVYDVRDLTSQITDFQAPEMVIGADVGGVGAFGVGAGISFTGGAEAGVVEAATLADIIQNHIQPTSWGEQLGTSIEDRGGKLVVMQRPEVHTLIAQLLRSFRESQTLQVLCEAKFLEVRDSFLEDIGVDWTDIPTGDIPAPPAGSIHQALNPHHPIYRWPGRPASGYSTFGIWNSDFSEGGGGGGYNSLADSYKEIGAKATFFNARQQPFGTRLGGNSPWGDGSGALFAFRYTEVGNFQAQMILHLLKKEEKGDLLMAPRVMMYNNQRAFVLYARQRGYISDYDISGGTYDPVIRTILTGTVLEVKPTVSHDRRYITLELKPSTASRLTFDIAYLQSEFRLPIYLPIIQLRTVRATVTLPDGGTLLLSGLMTETKHHAHSGIPVLSDLPIIGRLFGTDLKQDERMNLLIMVKVKLILFDEEERKL